MTFIRYGMTLAIELAFRAGEAEEVPVGAVILHNISGEILAAQQNKMCSLNDPTAHAELLAIQEACKKWQTKRLYDCTLFVTLEPCPMCAQAISFAQIPILYFGAYDPKSGGVIHNARIFDQKSAHSKPHLIRGGVQEKTCSDLLKSFFQAKRLKN